MAATAVETKAVKAFRVARLTHDARPRSLRGDGPRRNRPQAAEWSAVKSPRRMTRLLGNQAPARVSLVCVLLTGLVAACGSTPADESASADVEADSTERAGTESPAADDPIHDPGHDPDHESDDANWDAALRSISDPYTCPAYGGLELARQPGFTPARRNPSTGLWEFVHTSGIEFVLIPGGRYWKGAQRQDPSKPAFDPYLEPTASRPAVRAWTVEPFLLATHELTVSEWARLSGNATGGTDPDMRPITSINWQEATATLERAGLTLPTSVQWEYAARGGKSSPWWTGETPASLEHAENLRDASARPVLVDGNDEFEAWDDGYPAHAPVGTFAPNPYGLYDVHGNAFEWCRDDAGPNDQDRIVRGGGAFVSAVHARVSIEWQRARTYRGGYLGLRPSCELDEPPGLGGRTRRR